VQAARAVDAAERSLLSNKSRRVPGVDLSKRRGREEVAGPGADPLLGDPRDHGRDGEVLMLSPDARASSKMKRKDRHTLDWSKQKERFEGQVGYSTVSSAMSPMLGELKAGACVGR
jgi:hypothetical protein